MWGVAYPGVRDNRSTINTKTGYDDDDDEPFLPCSRWIAMFTTLEGIASNLPLYGADSKFDATSSVNGSSHIGTDCQPTWRWSWYSQHLQESLRQRMGQLKFNELRPSITSNIYWYWFGESLRQNTTVGEWYPTGFPIGTNTVYHFILMILLNMLIMDQISIYVRMMQSYFLFLIKPCIQPRFKKIWTAWPSGWKLGYLN